MSKLDKESKLKNLKLTKIDDLTEEQIDILYKLYNKQNKKNKIINNKNNDIKTINESKQIDINTDKYKILLKFVNNILTNIGKPVITNLIDFKSIDRLDILTEKNKLMLEEMEPEIWQLYNKVKCGAYIKSDNRLMNIFRGMLRDNNLQIDIEKKDITERNGKNKGYRKTHLFYTIKQNI